MAFDVSHPGGQAGSSSRIENYLGFPTGVSGLELASRAYMQAEKFGADLLIDGDRRDSLDAATFTYEITARQLT